MAYCDNCDNKSASYVVISYSDKKRTCACDRCGAGRPRGIPDVYLGQGGGFRVEENLADPKTGQPIPFSSRREKADIMKRLNLKEAGDRKHGAR